jgi:hypothetical protein
MSNMPDFNFTQFAEDHGIAVPEMFQSEEAPRPGLELKARGLKPKHPIIIVPGFVTSGLELWEGRPCAARYFRSPSPPHADGVQIISAVSRRSCQLMSTFVPPGRQSMALSKATVSDC